jgi:cation:H+ antiporter
LLIHNGNRAFAGQESHAVRSGISQLIVGLTVVVISISVPERMTSILATLNDNPEVTPGNLIGRNVVNSDLTNGLIPLARPFTMTAQILEKEALFLP